MNIKEQIEELVKISREFENDTLDVLIESSYQELVSSKDSDEILELISEISFLVDEVSTEDQEDIKEEIEIIIEEIKDSLLY